MVKKQKEKDEKEEGGEEGFILLRYDTVLLRFQVRKENTLHEGDV